MVINKSTVRVDVFGAVYAILNTVVDPLSRGKQWIFTTMPNLTPSVFVGYPIIVLNKARIKKKRVVLKDDYSDKSTPITYTIYSTSNSELDSLSDSVDAVMIPSNFPQFDFKDYDETDAPVNYGSGVVQTRTMTNTIELMGIE